MINLDLKQEVLKNIDISRQSIKNNLDITLESYVEIIGRLDFLTYLITKNDKKQSLYIMKISFFWKIMV